MNDINADYIQAEVTDLMANSMTCFSFEDIIDCSDDLTDEEKAWAKEHLDWEIVFVKMDSIYGDMQTVPEVE